MHYFVNLSIQAREGRFVVVPNRDQEVGHVIEILARSGKSSRHRHNPILVGDANPDRFHVVLEVVRRLASGTVPVGFGAREVWALSMEALKAGTPLPQIQGRLIQEIETFRGTTGKVILVMDDFHRLVGGDLESWPVDIGSWLKPVLGHGELQFLGITTLGAYQRFVEADAALQLRTVHVLMGEQAV